MQEFGACVRKALFDHPCFYGSAKGRWGRVHLPVAPDCNIQCNFCNRLYDCANESRPAVTKMILEPHQASAYLHRLFQTRSDISVVGISGPGDPLCDPQRTLETLRAVHTAYPHLLLCLSTNGLNVSSHVDDLVAAGLTHVTLTINAVDPAIGAKIHSRIIIDEQISEGREAAQILYARQREAVVKLKARNVVVKVNTVIVPGINDRHVRDIAAAVAGLGAAVMNCIAMISLPDTPFGHLPTPTEKELAAIREQAAAFIPQMDHCRRCRADAVGRLGESSFCSMNEASR